jgi:hypothetical protein
MLKVHTDKEIIPMIYRDDKRAPYGISREFLDFLRKGADLTIYGTPNQNESHFISELMQGRGDALLQKVSTELSQSQDNIASGNPYQVLFFNISDDEKKKLYRSRIKHLTGFTDDRNEVFARLSRKAYFRVGDVESPFEFSDWSDVLPDLPVSDIIITDPYLFEECDGENPIEENYYRLLDEIARKYKLDSLIVFSKRLDYELRTELISESQKILGTKQVHILTIEDIREHDRYIFLNYHTINAGSSMNYFNDEGEVAVKYASKIDVIPMCNGENFNIAQDMLRRLSQEIESLRDKKKISHAVTSKLFFYQKD